MEVERREEAASEEVRTRRKNAKQQKKLEKKARKEEEFLRDLRRPKSTKVTLAGRNFIEKISTGSRPDGSFEFTSADFPELSSSSTARQRKSKPSMPPTTDESRSASVDPFPSIGENSSGSGKLVGPGKAKPEEPVQTVQFRKADKKNHILLNLGDLIVGKPPQKRKKRLTNGGAKLRSSIKSKALSGNMLDSSNPKRYRGKHWETEKRTLTKLKLAVVRDRILSMKEREKESRTGELDREQFKLEVDLYLSDLMKKLKLAKAERVARRVKTDDATEVVPVTESAEPAKKGKRRKTIKYRKYCDNKYSEDLDKAVNALVQYIVCLQDRAFGKNPIKARAKPRHVVGLREVKKCLMLHKLKMIIVAPDLEAQETVFNVIEELKNSSRAQNVPCVFALSRRQLGYATKKFVPVSALGIISYDGLEEKFAAVRERLIQARDRLEECQRLTKDQSPHFENIQSVAVKTCS